MIGFIGFAGFPGFPGFAGFIRFTGFTGLIGFINGFRAAKGGTWLSSAHVSMSHENHGPIGGVLTKELTLQGTLRLVWRLLRYIGIV